MKFEDLERIVALIEQSSLMEFSYEDEEVSFAMSKLDNPPVVAPAGPMMPPMMPPAGAPAPAPAAAKDE